MVLRVTAARQALWTLLPRCQTEFLRSILSINSGHIIASHPRSQVLFCPASISLQTLWPFFKSWMARLVNSLQRCNGAYLSGRFWKLNSKTEFSLGDKFKPCNFNQYHSGVTISAASKTTTRTMPSSPPCDWRSEGTSKENEAAHEVIIYYM